MTKAEEKNVRNYVGLDWYSMQEDLVEDNKEKGMRKTIDKWIDIVEEAIHNISSNPNINGKEKISLEQFFKITENIMEVNKCKSL